ASYTWEGFLAAVEDLARWLGPATVVGHDWGGALGVHLAVRFPDLVRHLVLMEPQVFPETWDEYPGERGERFRRLRDPVSGTDLILGRNLMVEQISDGVCRQLDEDELDGYRYPYPTPESRRAIQRLVQMKPIGPESETYAFFSDLESRLPSVSVPLTALVVEGGPLLPPSRIARLERAVRDARVVHLGEGRHHFHEDHAARIAHIVRDLSEGSV
ncbi:MAG: alpha/beta fold hydrolase, partial [Actinomycetota bacterium]